MAKYYENLGEMTPDNLIADIDAKFITGSATIASGAGELKRGTVMAINADGKLAVMGGGASEGSGEDEAATASATALTPYGILCDDVDASEGDVVAEVYLTGRFKKGGLHVADGYELTAADIKALRDGGIFVENAVAL